jgi:hypothetical protein
MKESGEIARAPVVVCNGASILAFGLTPYSPLAQGNVAPDS